jgi:hypothetical protein
LSNRIGFNDALIAETTKRYGATLYTLNEKHFKCIPDLSYKVPYQKQENNKKEPMDDTLKIKVASVSRIEGKENHFQAKVRVYIPIGEQSHEKVTSEKYKNTLENQIETLLNARDFRE